MSHFQEPNPDRWEELHVARLLFGLTAEEQGEYDQLAGRIPAEKAAELERVVAAIDLAWSDTVREPLPEHLRGAIQAQAAQELAALRGGNFTGPMRGGRSARTTGGWWQYAPWLVSAACVALSLSLWMGTRAPPNVVPRGLAERRRELVEGANDLVQVQWTRGTTPIAGATGDVVWSGARQEGYMRFRGLKSNEPTKEQYQLWIFDKNQSDKTPVDGGVFDVPSEDEVIVPIAAKLRVKEAFMFAVTIEKPGGVVVSSRERLPLLAKVE